MVHKAGIALSGGHCVTGLIVLSPKREFWLLDRGVEGTYHVCDSQPKTTGGLHFTGAAGRPHFLCSEIVLKKQPKVRQ